MSDKNTFLLFFFLLLLAIQSKPVKRERELDSVPSHASSTAAFVEFHLQNLYYVLMPLHEPRRIQLDFQIPGWICSDVVRKITLTFLTEQILLGAAKGQYIQYGNQRCHFLKSHFLENNHILHLILLPFTLV